MSPLEPGTGQRRPYTKRGMPLGARWRSGPEHLDASVWLFSCTGTAGPRPVALRALAGDAISSNLVSTNVACLARGGYAIRATPATCK